jgi:hypothetical protein
MKKQGWGAAPNAAKGKPLERIWFSCLGVGEVLAPRRGPGVAPLAILLLLSACDLTPADLGITGPTPNALTAITAPQPPGGNADAQAIIPGVQTGDAVYATPSIRAP